MGGVEEEREERKIGVGGEREAKWREGRGRMEGMYVWKGRGKKEE
jgi:hypothetical protein